MIKWLEFLQLLQTSCIGFKNYLISHTLFKTMCFHVYFSVLLTMKGNIFYSINGKSAKRVKMIYFKRKKPMISGRIMHD